ncbi:MCM DNA helicase complex subunit [Perkinsus chesapeaki]|uniref:MCM DNA helicase complex subunit n=1 Tax=Perkinsus chesapeaki TaxID=330153 RepID=A0A7J6LB17_PERCH|nr:MCM DNA helicase complex subunit [Perkinsus chesapeaki]
MLKGGSVLFCQRRGFAITSIRDVRPGQVLKLQGKFDSSPVQYWRINELNLVKQKQEGVASCIAIAYLNLSTMKNGKWKAQMKERVDVVELDTKNCQVLYYDEDARILFVNDENFNQIEIPLRLIKGAEKLLQAGDTIGVGMDGEVIVQISLPGGVIQQIRSIGVDDNDDGDK